MSSEILEAEVIKPVESEPIISVVVDLHLVGEDQTEIRVKYPLGKRLIVLGMLEEAKYRIQLQDQTG